MRIFRAFAFLTVLLSGLAGCAAESIWASDEEVARARYVHAGPPELVLITSLADEGGSGQHTALLINASERVLFDPAGNWIFPPSPERNDVRFGMNPSALANYMAFQAQPNYHAVLQRITVSPDVAERALQLALANGAVPPAMCTSATANLLRQVPGFSNVTTTMFPKTLMESFGALPGVETTIDYGPPPNKPGVPRLGPHAVTG
jgi:hypothetical protein